MSQRVIGITCSIGTPTTEGAGERHYVNRAYVWAVEQAGGAPVLLPALRDAAAVSRVLGAIDGLLLSGGGDVDPKRYGQSPIPELGAVEDDRDLTEMALIPEAISQGVSIFAICRGIQVLNVSLGGSLYQDLPAERPTEIQHQQSRLGIPRDKPSHAVNTEPGSRLHSIVQADRILTNSFHHQAVREVGGEMRVSARADDGVVEALESAGESFCLAVQFHPEETAPNDEGSRKLFAAFVAAAG